MATLVGMPDEQYGELPTAVIVMRPGISTTAEDIINFCRDRLAAFKCPRSVVFADALPATATGKVARRQLRDHLAAMAAAGSTQRETS